MVETVSRCLFELSPFATIAVDRAGFVIEDTFEPKHGDANAAPGSFGHRCWFVPPYIAMKARRTHQPVPTPKVLLA